MNLIKRLEKLEGQLRPQAAHDEASELYATAIGADPMARELWERLGHRAQAIGLRPSLESILSDPAAAHLANDLSRRVQTGLLPQEMRI